MTGIFLSYNDEVMMIHRNKTREMATGLWAIPGGHVEPEEINDPAAACLRELHEETGLLPEDIENFFPRYIVFYQTQDELQVFYDFTASCPQKKPLRHSSEGQLYWVKKQDILSLEMPLSMRLIMEHYLENSIKPETLIGILRQNAIHWQPLL